MTIIAATNFSEGSRRASLVAAALARARGGPLWLVHQMEPIGHREQAEVVRQALRALLATEAERLRDGTLRVETALLEGAGMDAVSAFAASHHAELIVAGPNRPVGEVGGDLERLAQTAAAPLLVVKDEAPLLAWAQGEGRLRVVLGVDRSLAFMAAKQWLTEMRKFGALELIAARVFHPFEECARLGLSMPYVVEEIPAPLEEALTREVRGLLDPGPDGAPVPVILQPSVGRYADQLVEVAGRVKANLVMLGSHQRHGVARMWSVSHYTLRLAPMSVLSVPATAASVEELPKLRRVLVGTDLSTAGSAAIPYAAALAGQGGTVHLVHVDMSGGEGARRESLRAQLSALVPQASEAEVVCEVISGPDEATALVQMAERLNVDAICLASKAAARVLGHIFGSVTNEVLRQTRRPVFIVRPPEG